MKAKLWEVKFEDWCNLTINAKNIDEALNKAKKEKEYKDYSIEKIELIAEED